MSAEDPIAAFRIEALDVLDEVEHGLLDLGQRLDDADVINAVFRGLHTIKGSGAMFGFDALANFTHHCESAFDKVRKGQVAATADLVSVILMACDHMRALLRGEMDDEACAALLGRLAEVLAKADTAPIPADNGPVRQWRVKFRLPPASMANGTNPLTLLAELRELGEADVVADTDAIPSLADLEPTHCHIGWDVSLRGPITREDIEDVFLFVADDMTLEITDLTPDVGEDESATAQNPIVSALPPEALAFGGDNRGSAETVRVPADRLDVLMNRVGELVIAQSRLAQISSNIPDIALRSVSEEIERLADELRGTMMVLRMVPVEQMFGRFRRLVHDLGRETGKQINLVTDGEGTEVDKTVVERLFDPIVHIIRNSCDHGLEDSAARLAAGKDEAGTIRLSAHQSGGQVVITIADDGRGIDTARVRAKAEAGGLIEPGAAISDAELVQLIFHPGFSTAAQVTSLSGRGVGMDVVKRTIESLRGTIDVANNPGAGAVITLNIPLTLAIIEGLLVRVGRGSYVLPLSAVEECIELSPKEDLRSNGRSLVTLRDKVVPFLRLREMFACTTPADPFQKMVVVSSGDTRVGLVVDQIFGNHQTVIKSMSPFHRRAAAFAGATILGDGGVALILDIGHLLAAAQPREERLRAVG